MSIFKKGTLEPEHSDPFVEDTSSYFKLYKSMIVRSGWSLRVANAADKVSAGKERYDIVAAETSVPWAMIGCIHLMEGDCDFKTHLHNGDSLAQRTIHVPKGRPKVGNPPFTWEESAVDALSFDGIKPPLTTIGEIFGALEKFNGMGYRNHGVNTPYLWSGSYHYNSGKYVSDGVWEAGAVSKQVGIALIWKYLSDHGLI